jgi:ATP-dependent exoDNAse (exonuclease V) beta subunit
MTPMHDADARKAILEDLDDTLVVEAAAGTGKTTELVKRIVRVLATARATMDEIVAVTFTEKAAGELKLRLREALELEHATSRDSGERKRLEDGLRRLEEAHVNTIHGFCAELLRERPVEAVVDPLFAVLTEPQAQRLYARAFSDWLQQALANPTEGVRRALRRTSGPWFGGEDAGPIDRVRTAGWTLADLRDFVHPWNRQPFDREAEIDRLVPQLHALAKLSSFGPAKDNLFKSLDGVRRLSRQIELEQSLRWRDLDGWEARLVDLARDQGLAKTKKGYGPLFGSVPRTKVLAARDEFHAAIVQFRADADADLAALLREELQPPIERYQALKAQQGALDFVDLLTRTRDVLRANVEMRRYLQGRFKRVFVDEFQDTDPVQAEILLLLSADNESIDDWRQVRPQPGKLFIVGDPKQAIYRFRGADVGTYWHVRDQLETPDRPVLQLTTSFRAVPEIQRFVNCAFQREMVEDKVALQAPYQPLGEDRKSRASQPAIVALSVPAPYSSGRTFGNSVTGRAIESSLPNAVGAFINWLVNESGWEVSDRPADGGERWVPIRPQHIAILFRRFTSYSEDMTRPYITAIEARSIPHLLVGGKTFHGREEVETIRAALAAVEWPDDELSVFATLKGSLFGIDDELLLEYRDRFGAFHPYRVARELGGNSGTELALAGAPTTHLMPIADALRVLQDLHRRRNYRPVAETIARVLAATRAHVGFILWPGGEQALANVLHVAELARQYEANGGISFRGFIDELRRAAADTEAAEAPIVEEGSGGVRLITVHKAKGLEFPVVILVDPTCRLHRDEASRYLDARRRLCAVKLGGWTPRELHEHELEEVRRDHAEGVRLAYVAATRARDLLVVPAVGDEPWEGGWLSPLKSAIYPPRGEEQRVTRGPGCPPIKSTDSLLERPDDRPPDARTIAPGAHDFGGYSVVWWDPRWLELAVPSPAGIRRQDLIVKEAPREVVAERRRAYDDWRAARDQARATGGVLSVTVQTAREWIERNLEVKSQKSKVESQKSKVESQKAGVEVREEAVRYADVQIVDVRSAGQRSGGAAFGLLVHGILSQTALGATRDVVERIAMAEARVLGLGGDDVAAAVTIAERMLAHELMTRARAAEARGACRRETPVSCMIDGGIVEGVVDLAFEEDGEWVVVDYKTDLEIAASGEERYRRQVAFYAHAIAQATARPARGVLVRL